jgi:type IV pilus assembly protein PilM
MAWFGRKKTTVGLDIGSGLVKVAVVDHSKSTPELIKVAITPLPDDAIVEGEVMDPHLVSDVIRTTIESVDANTKAVVAAVGGRDVIIKRIKTERVKEAQARELMRWEAEQHVPDVDSVELDFQILDEDGDGRTDEYSFVAAKRDLVKQTGSRRSRHNAARWTWTPSRSNAFELNYPNAMTGAVGLVVLGTGHQHQHSGRWLPILTRYSYRYAEFAKICNANSLRGDAEALIEDTTVLRNSTPCVSSRPWKSLPAWSARSRSCQRR